MYDRFDESIKLTETKKAQIEYQRFACNAEIEHVLFGIDWPFHSELTTHLGATYTLLFKADNFINGEKIPQNLNLRPLNPYLGLGFNTQFAGNFKFHVSVKQNILSYFKSTQNESIWDVFSISQKSFRIVNIGLMYVW